MTGVLMLSLLATSASDPDSGLEIGAMVPKFHPTHVSGALKGTDGCPP
jgi:hypothetical protein